MTCCFPFWMIKVTNIVWGSFLELMNRFIHSSMLSVIIPIALLASIHGLFSFTFFAWKRKNNFITRWRKWIDIIEWNNTSMSAYNTSQHRKSMIGIKSAIYSSKYSYIYSMKCILRQTCKWKWSIKNHDTMLDYISLCPFVNFDTYPKLCCIRTKLW